MNVVLDIFIILLFGFFLFQGYRKGFIRSFVSFIGVVVALVVAFYFASFCAEFIYKQFIYDSFVEKINTAILSSIGAPANVRAENFISSLPVFISGSLQIFGISKEKIAMLISSPSSGAAAAIADALSPIIINCIKLVCATLIFLLLVIGTEILAKSISKICKLPFLRQLNGFLGMLFGAFKGFMLLVVVVMLIDVGTKFSDKPSEIFSDDVINSTFIFKHIYNDNPIYKLTGNINM